MGSSCCRDGLLLLLLLLLLLFFLSRGRNLPDSSDFRGCERGGTFLKAKSIWRAVLGDSFT